MNRVKTSLILLLSISCWKLEPAFAQNLDFLSRAPIAQMSEADQDMYRAAFDEALDEVPDGERLEWQNPDTGTEGIIRVIDTHEDYGTTCRTIHTATRAGGRTGAGTYRLCLAEDQTWQFAPARREKGSAE